MTGLVTDAHACIAGNEQIVIAALGIDAGVLNGKHGPCPMCGGKDRFRLDLKKRSAKFYCNQCGHGDMLDLIQRAEGLADVTAAAFRALEILGLPARRASQQTEAERATSLARRAEMRRRSEEEVARRATKEAEEAMAQRKKARRAWAARKTLKGAPAGVYWAQARGLGQPPSLGSIASLPATTAADGSLVPPCMIAAFAELDADGAPLIDGPETIHGIHLTRLARDGAGKAGTDEDKIIIGRGHTWPIVVSLGMEGDDTLVVTEGIEDAASAALSTNHAAWAAGVANRLEGLAQHIPAWVETVIIVEDDDADIVSSSGERRRGAGPAGTLALAVALQAKGIEVLIERGGVKPAGAIKRQDLNACLTEFGPEAVADRLAQSIPLAQSEVRDSIEDRTSLGSKDESANASDAKEHKETSRVKDNSGPVQDGKEKSSKKGKPALHVVEGGRGGSSDSDDGRPVIQIVANELHTMAADAEKHLIGANVPFFVRSGMLVRPVREPQFDSQGKETYTSALINVTSANMRERMSECIAWEKFSKTEKAWLSADPPKDLVEIMMDRRGDWAWLPIAGVISTPTLRPDGSILNRTGYDKATRLYVAGTVDLPSMPDKPTKQDAQDALEMLEGLVSEFPFADKASESVALSAVITVTVRGSMAVVPAHIARAHTAGTGKSYLFDIASAVANGTRCAIMTAGRDDAETEKRLGAKALAGHPIINIDNVNGDLGGDNLCQLISQPSCDIRVLGTSNIPTVVNRSCIFATGNNIRLVGDMTRRSIICSLDSPLERPEERKFEGDPVGDVLRDRGTYIAACMTIVRAYIAAGRPRQALKPMNGFEDWSNNVRAALVWLGKADPCETMTLARDEDPQLQQLSQFLVALREDIGVGERHARTSGQLWKDASETSFQDHTRPLRPVLAEAMAQWVNGRKFNGVWFGRWLNAVKGRIVEGRRLSCIKDSHKKTFVWFVESVRAE